MTVCVCAVSTGRVSGRVVSVRFAPLLPSKYPRPTHQAAAYSGVGLVSSKTTTTSSAPAPAFLPLPFLLPLLGGSALPMEARQASTHAREPWGATEEVTTFFWGGGGRLGACVCMDVWMDVCMDVWR